MEKNTISYPFYYGGLASACAACVTHPLDLIKVRLQTNSSPLRSSFLRTSLDIVRKESIYGLFNGLSASLLRQLTYSTARFGLYDMMKFQYLSSSSSLSKHNSACVPFSISLLMGLSSGAFAGALGNPADVVNVRMQNDGKLPLNERRNYRNALDGLIKVARLEGPRSLFRGVSANVGRAMVLNSSQLVSYDIFKQFLCSTSSRIFPSDSIYTHFLASVAAGLVATTCSSPLDVVKTRFMSSNIKNSKNIGLFNTMVLIIRQEGLVGLFKGWLPSFTRLGPQTVITFVILEKLKGIYRAYFLNSSSKHNN